MIWLYLVSLASALLMFVLSSIKFSIVGFRGAESPLGLVSFVVGGLFVFIFYWVKFNEWAGKGQSPQGFRPRPVRYFTTWYRYLAWSSFYGIMMTVAYALFMFFPAQIMQFISHYQQIDVFKFLYDFSLETNLLNNSTDMMVPWVIILITFVWSGMAPCAQIEKRIRLYLQDNASIPSQARQLIDAFEDDETNFSPNEEVRDTVIKKMAPNILEPNDFNDPGNSLWFHYARVIYLYHVLVRLSRSKIFSKLKERYLNEFKKLDASIEQLQNDVQQRVDDIRELCFGGTQQHFTLRTAEKQLEKYLNPLEASNPDQKASRAEKAFFSLQNKELKNNLDAVSRDVIQLIVCSVLVVGFSRDARRDLLGRFGLVNTDKFVGYHLDWQTMTLAAGGAVGIVSVCTIVYLICQAVFVGEILGKSAIIPSGPAAAVMWSLYAGFMHSIAIGGGYFMQQALEINRQKYTEGEMLPLGMGVQLAEALLVASFGFILNVIFIGLILFSQNKGTDFSANLWWAGVPSVTAFFAALYTQNTQRSEAELKNLFLWQGICTGLMAVFILFVVHYDKLLGNVFLSDTVTQSGKMYLIYTVYAALTSAILGWVLGKIFKAWVLAERYSGNANRREGMRRRYLFKQGKWLTDSGEIDVQALSVSPSGAELKSPKPLDVRSVGTFLLSGVKKNAVVVRNDQRDKLRSFVKFLTDEPQEQL